MKKTYTGILRSAYFAPKKFINVLGQRILFIEGVSREIPEDAALHLLSKKILSSITENPLPVVEVAPEPVVEEVVEMEFEIVEDEVYDGEVTAERLLALYEEHGTWSAVASILEMTPAALKKLRDEFEL